MNDLMLTEAVRVRTWLDGKYVRQPESYFLDFVIDGTSLRLRAPDAVELVTELNRPWLPGLDEAVEILMGRRAHPDLGPGRIPVLVCGTCGGLDCGALTAQLTVSDSEVRWSEWRWVDYAGENETATDLADFTFEPTAYEAVLAGAGARLGKMPYDELAHKGKRFLWPWQWGWKLP